MRRTPLRPSRIAREKAPEPIPFGLTAPIPVMTQRRFMSVRPSALSKNSRKSGAMPGVSWLECQKLVKKLRFSTSEIWQRKIGERTEIKIRGGAYREVSRTVKQHPQVPSSAGSAFLPSHSRAGYAVDYSARGRLMTFPEA